MKHNFFVTTVAALVATVAFLAACTKTNNYKEKTEAERSEDYHKNLSTPDLSLFELKGNVRRVVYNNGIEPCFLVSDNMGEKADTVCFSVGGLCEAILLQGGDTLMAVRNTEGKITDFFKTSDEEIVVSFLYDEEGNVILNQPSSGVRIKVLSTDDVGNWTRREVALGDNRESGEEQKREISYY